MDEEIRKLFLKNTFNSIGKGYNNAPLSFFIDSAQDIASLIEYSGDEKVLDVATGTGHVAFNVSTHLPKGQVVGIDLSTEMLAQAEATKKELNLNNIEFLEMDMQSLDFPDDYFDTAICALGIFFVQDIEGLLLHISDKVKSSGKIVISTFHEDTFMNIADLFWQRLNQYGIEKPTSSASRIAKKKDCITFFQTAGLEDIIVEEKDIGRFIKDSNDWWDIVWNSAFRAMVSLIPPQDLDKFKTEHLKEVKELVTEDGIWLEMKVLYTMGTKK